MTELTQRYMPVAKTFSKGKKWRPGGNKPYLEILLALCKIPESVVTFDKLLYVLPERRKPGIKAVRTRITEVLVDPVKNVDLRKHIAFDPDAGFSIEDPLFRYFLNNLDPKRLYQELGVEDAVGGLVADVGDAPIGPATHQLVGNERAAHEQEDKAVGQQDDQHQLAFDRRIAQENSHFRIGGRRFGEGLSSRWAGGPDSFVQRR